MSNQYQIQAMLDRGIGLSVVNLKERFVMFENGVKAKILHLYDADHEETRDLSEVRYYEFGDKKLGYGDGWITELKVEWETLH